MLLDGATDGGRRWRGAGAGVESGGRHLHAVEGGERAQNEPVVQQQVSCAREERTFLVVTFEGREPNPLL